MENKVGDTHPSDEEIESILKDMASLKERIAKWGVLLSSEQRQGVTKLRAGAEELAPRLVALAQKNKVEIKGVPLDGLTADLKLVKAVRPIEQAVEGLWQLVADTRLEANSEAAQAFYAYYSRLSQMSETDPELENELAPLTSAMATGRRKK